MENKNESRCKKQHVFTGSIWCDDHADVWVGSCDKLGKQVESHNFNFPPNPDEFRGAGGCCDYLYFVCWANRSGENGLMVQLNGGGNQVLSGDPHWEVYPANINYDGQRPRPLKELIECKLKEANCEGWKPVTVGPANQKPKPLHHVPGIANSANFIWYDSGADSRADAPFLAFDHGEFLIFRYPVKMLFREECHDCRCVKCKCKCGCDCHGCNDKADEQNLELMYRAMDKAHVETSGTTCGKPFSEICEKAAVGPNVSFQPCFYFHYKDGASDQVEEHDTEVFYLTVCNDFRDITYKGLKLTKIRLVPTNPIDEIQIVPDRFICIDCLEACSCQTREFAIITRGNNIAGNYSLEVEYCYDEIVIHPSKGKKGAIKFPLEITED